MNERLANEIKELLTPPDTAEFVEAWQGFLRRHIEPSRLFKVSQDMADPTPDEMKHLCNCVPCRTAYDSYRASSILHKRDETIVELRAKLAEREAAAGAKDKALAEARSRIIAMLENGHWRNGYTDATGMIDEGETGTARFVDEVVRQIDAALDGSTGRTSLAEREAERAELEHLRQYKELYRVALDCVDRVFQTCTTIPEPVLPNFCALGESKFTAVVRLAETYVAQEAELATLRARLAEVERERTAFRTAWGLDDSEAVVSGDANGSILIDSKSGNRRRAWFEGIEKDREQIRQLSAELAEANKGLSGYKAEHELLTTQVHNLRNDLNAHAQKSAGNYWSWQGDGSDHLESLTCPVLIPADRLRALQSALAEARATCEAWERLTKLLSDRHWALTTFQFSNGVHFCIADGMGTPSGHWDHPLKCLAALDAQQGKDSGTNEKGE